jgi:ABC-type Fe3+ transport system permease subunit
MLFGSRTGWGPPPRHAGPTGYAGLIDRGKDLGRLQLDDDRGAAGLPVLAVLVDWQSFPFIAVTVLAGLKTVPAELLEAARVDGATPWRVSWRIFPPSYGLGGALALIFTLILLVVTVGYVRAPVREAALT